MRRFTVYVVMLFLAACGTRQPVPVADSSAPLPVESAGPAGTMLGPAGTAGVRAGYYIVKKGDTVRRIAQEHGKDFRDIIAWNNLTDASKIEIGQELRIVPPDGAAVVKPVTSTPPVVVMGGDSMAPGMVAGSADALKRDPKGGKVPYSPQALAQAKAMDGSAKPADAAIDKPATSTGASTGTSTGTSSAIVPGGEAIDWTWPVAGKLISEFTEGAAGRESNKGIDLAGRMGEPIHAAAAGKVLYVGSLRGYGDFLVVQHNTDFNSVYAHTSKILVKKDQAVTKGQKIAEVGSSDADQSKLHFEIRRQGKPIDPLKLLPTR